MKKIYIVRIVLIALIGFWMGTIFGFSSENGESSQSFSDKITVKVIKYIEPEYESMDDEMKQDIFDKTSFFVRKTGHFGEYGILGALITMFAMTFRAYRCKKIRYQLMTVIVPFIYACTDEFHQGFVDGRSPKLFDVCIDTCGALTAIVIMIGISILIKKLMTERDRNEDLGTVY